MTIKHIVLSGGGPIIFKLIGTLQYLDENKFYSIDNIETIYSTSAGSLLAIILSLKYDWNTINDYVINYPLKNIFFINLQTILDIYEKKGLYGPEIFKKILKPLFEAKEISLDINLRDFYNLTKIELHFFSFEINDYKITDISYLNYPELSIITALHMSCAIPILISPVFFDNKCFIDGALGCNYPINFCIENIIKNNGNNDEILGLKNNKHFSIIYKLHETLNFFEYIINFIFKALYNKFIYNNGTINNELSLDGDYMNIKLLENLIINKEGKIELLNSGKEIARNFLAKIT